MLSRFNEPQRAAVCHVDTPLLVLAGAGSGKTGVITGKIAWLLGNGYDAEEILAVTFTNKAAAEMRTRVEELLPNHPGLKSLSVSTFHRLGMRILFSEGGLIGLRPGFSIVSREDCVAMLGNLSSALSMADSAHVTMIVDVLGRWKNKGYTPDSVPPEEAEGRLEAEALSVFEEFEAYLIACNSVDLDGLLSLPLKILTEYPEARARWQARARYILVDEYQDTNRVQYMLIRELAGARNGLTVVGDDDQSIYTWRGADSANIEHLQRDYPNLEIIKLEQNYRCTNTILRAANAVIANNPRQFEKQLWSDSGEGSPIRLLTAEDETDEAEQIVDDITGRRFVRQLAYNDFAILIRSNRQARAFEKAMREARVPYRYTGGQSLFERTEIKDVIAYMRLIANADDSSAFLRVVNTPRRGIGAATLAKLSEIAQRYARALPQVIDYLGHVGGVQAAQRTRLEHFDAGIAELRVLSEELPADQVVERLLEWSDYRAFARESADKPERGQARVERVDDLVKWIKNMANNGRNFADIVRDFMLIGRDNAEETGDWVQLCTVHSAKGLEFNHVYIAGVEENLLPHRNSIDSDSVDEERRLMYVALTRARKSLVLSHCISRKIGREAMTVSPSRFLREIPEELIDGEFHAEQDQEAFEINALARLEALSASLKES